MDHREPPSGALEAQPAAALTEFDAIVLGAGMSGLVSASILSQQGCRRVLVLDEYDHIGGNHIDRAFGDYTFDVGSFIFQDDSPLLRHIPEILPGYVPIRPTFGRLAPQGKVSKYPISVRDDLLAAGPLEIARILLSVLQARVFHSRLTDARSFARFWMGERLLVRTGLEKYLERFYGVAPERIDLDFASKRMSWIKEHARLRTYVRHLALWRRPEPVVTPLVRPREGFAKLYAPARERLEKAGVTFHLGVRLDSIARDQPGLQVRTDDGLTFTAPRVVSTIPLSRAQELCGLPREAEPFKTVTMISLFYSFQGNRGFAYPILFNFSHAGAWKRLTMHSDFYGRASGREFFTTEVNAEHVKGSPDLAHEDFRSHTAANGILDGDLRLEGSNVLASAYPVYTEQATARAERAIIALKRFGVESFGRQGGFDYQPTARVSAIEAEANLGVRSP